MRPGTTIIQELRKGGCNSDLGEAINTAVERVKATGKKAKVILTLTIEPAGVEKGAIDVEVEKTWVADKVTVKLPELPLNPTLLFIDESNDLTREDPQRHIPGVKTA